ncbi:MAG: nucleotide-binding protein [Georgfuchsia sp.]
MKSLLAIFAIVTATTLFAAEKPVPVAPLSASAKGEVLEVKDVESYTYLRLRTTNGETWAAVPKTSVKKGDKVTIENPMVMNNFPSPTLKKTFPTILFGTLGSAGGKAAGGAISPMAAHASTTKTPDLGDVHVAKATGANARTVAEVVAQGAKLKDKPVLVRGKVVKYNQGIMGKNWVHLRDGTGSAADNTNDILVTTLSVTKVGDIVTAKGVVHTNKDFGAGYSFKVLVEEATLQP